MHDGISYTSLPTFARAPSQILRSRHALYAHVPTRVTLSVKLVLATVSYCQMNECRSYYAHTLPTHPFFAFTLNPECRSFFPASARAFTSALETDF